MLFSETNWNNAEELQPFVQTSAALSFGRCKSSFANAERNYLYRMFGERLMQRVQGLYESGAATAAESDLLFHMRNAEANLAFADDFDAFQVRLTDQGFQRQETEKFKQAFRYQENALQQMYLNRGLNALDRACEHLDLHSDVFPEWCDTEFCKERRTLIVQSAYEVNSVYFINRSNIIYMRLLPYIKQVSELELPFMLPNGLYQKFIDGLREGKEYVDDDCTVMTVTGLRKECVKYVVYKSLLRLVRETGSITDRGLYFGSTKSSAANPDEDTPSRRSDQVNLANQLTPLANKYARHIEYIVQSFFGKYSGGKECDVLKRDNTRKKSFWL